MTFFCVLYYNKRRSIFVVHMRQLAVFIFLIFNIPAFSQTPTVPASNITFPVVGCNEFTATWTNGNGNFRAVFVREGSALTEVPEYDEFYADNPNFGIPGESIKNDGIHWCVYKGSGNSITVKGLKKLTKYYIGVFEYNGGGGKYDYLTSSYATASVTTANIVADFKIQDSTGYDTAAQCQYINKFKFINKSYGDLTPLTYLWDFGDGTATSNVKDPVHKYTVSKIMFVKLIVGAPGCLTSITINDTVHPHPVAKFDLDPMKPKNDSIQCYFGNRFTFRNNSSLADIGAGKSSMRYEWHMDNGFIATGYKADRAFPSPGVKTIKLIAISNRGCRDSTYRIYKVLPRAIDPTKVVFNQKSMCLSNNLFTFKNNSPNSIINSWHYRDTMDTKDLDSSFKNPASYSFKKVGTYYVTLKAYDLSGCLDQDTSIVDVFKNKNVSFKDLKKEYCINDAKEFLTPTPAKGKFFGINVYDLDSSFTPASIGTFIVGYESFIGGCRDTAWDTTIVYNRPSIYIGKDTTICKDRPLQLNVDPALTSTWYSSPPIANINGYQGSFITVNQAGKYWVKSYERKCYDSAYITVKVISSPTLSIAFTDTTLCGGSYLRFSLKVEDGNVFWSDGNNSLDRIVSKSGLYKVILANKCGAVSDSFNLNVEETACIVFFPNAFTPNGDVLNDTWQPYGKYEFIRMNIFNRWGEQVYFSDKSPVWDGYNGKELCLDGAYCCVFEYLMQDGNTKKRVTDGLIIHLIR